MTSHAAPQIRQRPLQQPLDQYAGLSPTLARVLSARGVAASECQLSLKSLLQPDLLGLPEAVIRLDQAIDQQQHIVIVGDYDADGATSTALMLLALRAMGARVDYLVPDRFRYGYGLTPPIAELAHARFDPDLLVTVDNGISSHEGVKRCHELGMQVIITDHHLTTKATPAAEAVVNPNQLGCTFASKALAGVGVAFYVLAALATHRKQAGKSTVSMTQYLDLVALGTVADVARLDFNNRILVQAGLQLIRQGRCRPGILALLDIAGKTPAQLQARDFGFVLGPRINAAGRMQTMDIGIACLVSTDPADAYRLASELDQLNQARRQVEMEIRDTAFDQLQLPLAQGEELPPALVLYQPDWHQGVIGIVAGRLKTHYHRPSIVFARDQDGIHLKGSARSIEGIHIRDCIEEVAQQQPGLVRYFGGHAAAAGLTIAEQDLPAFRDALTAIIASHHADLFQSILWTDGSMQPDEFNLDFVQQIEQLGPWGQGFESPLFEGIFDVHDAQWLKEQHLKLWVKLPDAQLVEALAFGWRDRLSRPLTRQVRLAFTLDKNEFRGESRIQLMIQGLELVDEPIQG